MDLATIEREALSLPASDRAKLVNELLASLDDLPEAEIEKLWILESRRRIADLEAGRTRLIPAEEVFDKLRSRAR